MSISLTLQQFIEQLSDCGLMSEGEVSSFQQSWPPAQRAQAPKELAQALVERGKLTKFQVANVLHGKGKSLIIGEYVVLDKLGQGGVGVVVKARHRRMDRLVAIKVLSASAMKSPNLVQRFYREVKTAARLIHPNVVMAYDAGESEGVHFLVMELVEGPNLASVVSRCGPLPVAWAVDCIQQAARGLQYAHEHGVIHRDIKPGNLLVAGFQLPEPSVTVQYQSDAPTVDLSLATSALQRNVFDQPLGIVKILDMGLARISGAASMLEESGERLTESGQVMGTCDYMAPEQAESAHSADHRADIYSLGCTLYRLLTGQPPYSGDSLVHLLVAHQKAPIPALRSARPDVPEELDRVYRKMLAKDRDARQQSMTEVIADLEACARGLSGASAASPPPAAGDTVAWTPPSPTAATEPGSTPPPRIPARKPSSPAREQTPAPTVAPGQQDTFTIRVGEPRKGAKPRGRKSVDRPKPASEEDAGASKLPILAAAGGLFVLVVVLIVALIVVLKRRSADEDSGGQAELPPGILLEDQPPPGETVPPPGPATTETPTPPAAPTEPSPAQPVPDPTAQQPTAQQPTAPEPAAPPPPEPAPEPPSVLPKPSVTPADLAWQAAWDAADAQAKKLVAEGRYGAAADELKSLADRFPGTMVTEKVEFALQGIGARAQTAFQEVQTQAKQLLGEKKFAEARAALQTVLETHNWPASTQAANALLAEIDKAQQADGTPATSPAEPPPAEMTATVEPEPPLSEAESRYREALKPIEALAANWEFRQAAAALADVSVDEPALASRLAQRRDELQRLTGLKDRLIAAVAAASPPLDKMALMLRGANGPVTGADEAGIKTETQDGKPESHPWSGLKEQGRKKLLQLALNPDSGEDWLSAGLLMLVCKDLTMAEKYYDNAVARGMKVEPYLAPLATAALTQARELVDAGKSVEAETKLAAIEAKYGGTDWMADNRGRLAALQKAVQGRIADAGAEKIYADAVQEYENWDWFALQPLVDKLRTQYATAAVLRDAARKPTFVELEEAVADLGKQLVVNPDGKGDHRTIQAAIDAASPKSVIEIRSNGPFYEKLVIPADRPNLVLRGGAGFWPQVSSGGPAGTISELVTVAGKNTILERLVFTHQDAAGNVLVANVPCRVRHAIFTGVRSRLEFNAGVDLDTVFCATEYNLIVRNRASKIRSSLLLSGVELTGEATMEIGNALVGGPVAEVRCPASFSQCILVAPVNLHRASSSITDSVICADLKALEAGTRIEHCNVASSKFVDFAKPGPDCFSADPQFIDSKNLNFRFLPTSPCLRRAADGQDLGVRWSPDMQELIRQTATLRQQGLIRF